MKIIPLHFLTASLRKLPTHLRLEGQRPRPTCFQGGQGGSLTLQFIAASTLALIISLPSAVAAPEVFGEDAAANYGDQWDNESNKGGGFGPWILRNEGSGDPSHSGFYIATPATNPLCEGIDGEGKAFGMFANGVVYEQAVAFRAFERTLVAGDTFSFLIRHREIKTKFEGDDSAEGCYGFALRSGNASGRCDDYNEGARLEFNFTEGASTYQIFDGSEGNETQIEWIDAPISVSVTLLADEGYVLEVKNLVTNEVRKVEGRKLGGAAGSPIDSFSIFNRDGETNDVHFNKFQLAK